MARARREELVDVLRQRVIRALAPGTVRVHLATDDLSRIPPDAPTYLSQAARTHLGRMRVPGMLIPPTRLFAEDCIRALWHTIDELNFQHTYDDDAKRERTSRYA